MSNKLTTQELFDIHQETCKGCLEVMKKKNSDYTGGAGVDDPFANFNMSSVYGVDPAIGILLRMGDKMQRIKSFAADGALCVVNESVTDACEDIVNYAILLKAMFIERARVCAGGKEYAGKPTVATDEWATPKY